MVKRVRGAAFYITAAVVAVAISSIGGQLACDWYWLAWMKRRPVELPVACYFTAVATQLAAMYCKFMNAKAASEREFFPLIIIGIDFRWFGKSAGKLIISAIRKLQQRKEHKSQQVNLRVYLVFKLATALTRPACRCRQHRITLRFFSVLLSISVCFFYHHNHHVTCLHSAPSRSAIKSLVILLSPLESGAAIIIMRVIIIVIIGSWQSYRVLSLDERAPLHFSAIPMDESLASSNPQKWQPFSGSYTHTHTAFLLVLSQVKRNLINDDLSAIILVARSLLAGVCVCHR